MRARRRDLLGRLELGAQRLQPVAVHSRFELGPHHILLESDVVTAELHELVERLVIVRLTGLAVLEPLQQFLAQLLLFDGLVGELVTVVESLTHERPEVLLLDGLVLGFGDDQVGHHGVEAALPGAVPGRCVVEHLEHAQHALVVLA